MKKLIIYFFTTILLLAWPLSAHADPVLISPSNGQRFNTNTPSFDWDDTDMGHVTFWRFEISRSPSTSGYGGFSGSDLAWAKDYLHTSYINLESELGNGFLLPGTYYWHVYGGYVSNVAIWGTWSEIRMFAVPRLKIQRDFLQIQIQSAVPPIILHLKQ